MMQQQVVANNDGASSSSSTSSEPSLLSTTTDESTTAPTVVVIGCGPSGMSFLHAVASKRKQYEESGDFQKLAKLPKVTVYEKANSPGGVWRSNRNIDGTAGASNMYEGLWINSPKYSLEYFDYPFEEHFKGPTPLFLPRQAVLEYMLARMTQHEDIFQHVQFNTEVTSATYDDDDLEQFVIKTKNIQTGKESVQYFDKCIWASGCNGKPKMIPSLMKKLSNFKGKIVHAAEMDKLACGDVNFVKDKKILMIGDSYSSEDLALQCIKLGAGHVAITSRQAEGMACYMGSWPGNKVSILEYTQVAGVKDDDNECTTILFQSTDPETPLGVPQLEDVAIIIFCTGYTDGDDYLDESLGRYIYPEEKEEGNDDSDSDDKDTWQLEDIGVDSKTWRMKDNPLTKELGHIEPSSEMDAESCLFVEQGWYRGIFMDNLNMMSLYETTEYPLLDIDVRAWLLLAYITGEKEIPSFEEMSKRNNEDLLLCMNDLETRYEMDTNYAEAIAALGDDHWIEDWTSDEFKEHYQELCSFPVKFLARNMIDSQYPVYIGDINQLNEAGLALSYVNYVDCTCRANLKNFDEVTKQWMTFRDCDPSLCRSWLTGNTSIALKGKWLEIDDELNDSSSEEKKHEPLDSSSSDKDGSLVSTTVSKPVSQTRMSIRYIPCNESRAEDNTSRSSPILE